MPSRGQSGIATVLDWNTSTNVYTTGDAANVEIFFIKDGVVTTPTNQSALTESSSSAGGPIGAYSIAWTSAEGTCNTLWVGGQSSSANCSIIPITITFEQLPTAAPGSSNGLITVGSGAGQLNMASGLGFANVQQWVGLPPSALIGGLVQATFSGTTPAVNVTQIAGTATVGQAGYVGIDWAQIANPTTRQGLTATTISGLINSPAVIISGTPAVNVTQIAGVATAGLPGYVGVDWSAIANSSARQSLSFTNTSGLLNAPTVTLQGITSQAQFGVNLVTWEGASPSALIGGLVQSTFSGTTPAVNLTQIAGSATVGAAGYVGIDWSQIANPATRQGLAATTISGVINAPTVTITGITSQAQFGVNVVTWDGAVPSPLINGLVQATVSGTPGANVLTWLGSTPAALTGAGYVQTDLETWRTVVPNTLQSGRVDATVGQVQTNAIGTAGFVPGALTATVFAAPFLTSASYDSTYSNGLADSLGNRANAIETGLTPYQSWRLVASSQGGVLAGALTPTVTIDGAGVITNRITATCDSSGNRLAVVLSL